MKPGYQFIHIETYARCATSKKRSALAIAQEAERQNGHCPHIGAPKPYVQLYGCKPTQAVHMAINNAALATDSLGRKMRKDAQIIVSGVVSYPVETKELNLDDPSFKEWVRKNHEFLLKKFGDNYVSSVGHFHGDERFAHIHFYVIPQLSEDLKLDIGSIHPGLRAQKDSTGGRKEKVTAYSNAMRNFQDEYYSQVGRPLGLTRDGPRRRRLTRKEWILEKQTAVRAANLEQRISKLKAAYEQIKNLRSDLLHRFSQLQKQERKLATFIERERIARWTKNKNRNNESENNYNNDSELKL